ncbi:aKG-HExxH-type peptide beta-hydroxylase [Natronobiforma cellulositropha]|uniref:aKG-HExxH-type peptide beta-hydroxylase n=1 Tax=Natronobiforma cellulositropha TaxID=1679076 RepID=UPI0021D57F51|nr:HEXXH motif-containing putative peptide modification protein [Natronobiforma cellulositropha]
MNRLLTQQTVVECYHDLADERDDAPESYAPIIGQLPPYLCQRLALGASYPFEEGIEYAYTGPDQPALHWTDGTDGDGTIALVDGEGIGSLTDRLPLAGHRQATNRDELIEHTLDALERMETLEPDRLAALEEWTSLIVWLERAPGTSATVLTSSTFPAVPHCSFLTEKALRHIPPNSVADEPTDYALRENLYHEALHQQLGATLLHRDVLDPSYSAAASQKVPIPWRESFWEPDRALHAAVVYTGLVEMRADELDRDIDDTHRAWLEEATAEAEESLRHLIEELADREGLFTPAGEELFDALHGEAMEALTDQ